MKRLTLLVVIVLASVTCGFASIIVISNADFNVQPAGGWNGGNAAPQWDNRSGNNNEASDAFTHSGVGGSLKIWAGSGIYVAHQDATVQDAGLIPVGATQWTVDYWAYTQTSDYYTNGNINFHIEWFTNFSLGGETAPRSVTYLPQNITPDTWLKVSNTGDIPANATYWRFVFEQSATESGAVFLDDVTVTAVPEPATVGLLGIAGGLMLVRFARRKPPR